MSDKKRRQAGGSFPKSEPEPERWVQIKEVLLDTSNEMELLANKMTPEGHEHLTEGDKDLVRAAYAPFVKAVTNSLRVNIISGSRDRCVDDIEEIHRIMGLMDCL